MNESVAGRSERDELSPLRPRWEWSADEIKRIGRVVGMIAEHLTTLPEKPVFRPFPVELDAKYLDSKPPELGQEADDILAAILYLTNTAHRSRVFCQTGPSCVLSSCLSFAPPEFADFSLVAAR